MLFFILRRRSCTSRWPVDRHDAACLLSRKSVGKQYAMTKVEADAICGTAMEQWQHKVEL